MLRSLPLLLLGGCCCWPGGSSDYVEGRIGEELTEGILEASTGAQNVEVGADGQLTVTTAEGTVTMNQAGDGSMTFTTPEGSGSFGGAAQIPAGFPLTLPSDATGTGVISVPGAGGGTTVTATSSMSADQLEAHFRPQLEALGAVTDAGRFDSPGGSMRNLVVTEGSKTYSVTITTAPGQPASVLVAVTGG
jgi:hypothetical protein